MKLTQRATNHGLLKCYASWVLGALLCSNALAQDRFPPPGQAQAAMPAATGSAIPQQNGTNAFSSQAQMPQNPSGQSGAPGQTMSNAGGRGGFQMPTPAAATPARSPMAQKELQDFGIPPTAQLHAGAMHGPTPVSIPGGKVTTTDELAATMRQGQQQLLLFHVLGGQETLPNAQYAAPASAPGTFSDETQQAFSQYLNQVTRGQKNQPLVFYCASVQCWMSYNAALRAINSGYSNVIWYRGGIEAWKAAGHPTAKQ